MLLHLLKPIISGLSIFLGYLIPERMVKKISDYYHIAERDIRFILNARKALKIARKYTKNNLTVIDAFQSICINSPSKVCFYYGDTVWTFRDVQTYTNKVCISIGGKLNKGDVVVLFAPNCPEYVAIWLGLCKAGVITAVINTNLTKKPLLHCINVTNPRAIIFSNHLEAGLSEIMNDVEGSPTLYCLEGESSLIDSSLSLPEVMETADVRPPTRIEAKFSDTILYIFTSGTTGLPKPAKVTHSKLLGLALGAEFGIGLKEDDVVYCSMPLYHTAATSAVVCSFFIGFSVVIRTKFSASAFISDCRKFKATIAIYIGEMLRYIVNTEERDDDKDHCLRMVAGNGLRAEIWTKFAERFQVPVICEYYGSTEGNFLLVNRNKVVGSCGYLPIGIPYYYLLGPSLLKMDQETGLPSRGKNGLCIRAQPGEPGLCIGYCPSGNELRRFHGYVNDNDTDSKKVRNVYKQGDLAFNTGDVMVMDERGWLTFVDRLGDTFRWKGENVSTAEVESILNSSPDVIDCAVYGVQVGPLEGKAGMAAVNLKCPDLENLTRYIELSLPSYSRPLFLRLVSSLQYTSTFKVVKGRLSQEGFNLAKISDPLLVRLEGQYVPITNEIYDQIQQGKLKL